MNLLFIGIKPGKGLQKALSANGIAFKNVPRPTEDDTPAELILYAPKTLIALKEVDFIRKAYPNGWIHLVVPKSWMEDSKHQNALLQCEQKNGVGPAANSFRHVDVNELGQCRIPARGKEF